MGLVAPRHVGSSWTRAWTYVPGIGRWILNHCTTREVPRVRLWRGEIVSWFPQIGPLLMVWELIPFLYWTTPIIFSNLPLNIIRHQKWRGFFKFSILIDSLMNIWLFPSIFFSFLDIVWNVKRCFWPLSVPLAVVPIFRFLKPQMLENIALFISTLGVTEIYTTGSLVFLWTKTFMDYSVPIKSSIWNLLSTNLDTGLYGVSYKSS